MRRTDADPGLHALFGKIQRARGFGCAQYKPSCLRRRIAVRMRARGVHTYDEYGALLDRDSEELDKLVDTLTINVSKFFRNIETWTELRERVLPTLWTDCCGHVRCWSVGCSTGEEPYTLAMLLLERRGPGGERPRVDATDIDRAVLDRAARAQYRRAAFDETPPEFLHRWVEGTEHATISPSVRELVEFHRHDVLADPPPAPPYDLILCRNLLIYFDRDTQERVLTGFADALRPGGVLVLGKVEALVGEVRNRFDVLSTRERVYRRP